jgi:hypothetical protein
MLLVLAACLNPVAFGAKPNDGVSDTAAIQATIDAAVASGDDVCLGDGVWELERTKGLGSLYVHTGPLTIRGTGPRSILRLLGDGKDSDWHAIHIRGPNAREIILRDFAIDSLGSYNTDEQTHLIEIGPGSRDVIVYNMTLGPMRRPDQRVGQGAGGDCIRLLGNPGKEVENVVITRSRFVDCDRSGIGIQRSVRNLVIARNVDTGTGDQPIDFEPTGQGSVEDVVMVDLEIRRTMTAQGAWAVTIGGTRKDLASRIVLTRSKLEGGGILILNARDVDILDNQITHGPGGRPTIHIIRNVERVRLANNRITRPRTSPAGNLINLSEHSSHAPRSIAIVNNELRQETAGFVVDSSSVRDLRICRNQIHYTGGDPTLSIVRSRAMRGDIDGVTVEANTIDGAAASVLWVGNPQHRTSKVRVDRNRAPQIPTMLRCAKAASLADIGSDDAPDALAKACHNVVVKQLRRQN